MKAIFKLIIVILSLMTSYQKNDTEVDNPYKIEVKSYEFYKNKRSREIIDKCELDEMFAYHMSGDATSVGDANPICPSI